MGQSPRVVLGYFGKPHGVKGWIRAKLYNPDGLELSKGLSVWVEGEHLIIEESRRVGEGQFLVRMEEHTQKEHAQKLRGHEIEVERSLITVDDDDDEFLLSDLVGLQVYQGELLLGTVTAINVGPQDRMVIHSDGREILVPIVDELVSLVDFDAGVIQVDLPEEWPETQLKNPASGT